MKCEGKAMLLKTGIVPEGSHKKMRILIILVIPHQNLSPSQLWNLITQETTKAIHIHFLSHLQLLPQWTREHNEILSRLTILDLQQEK